MELGRQRDSVLSTELKIRKLPGNQPQEHCISKVPTQLSYGNKGKYRPQKRDKRIIQRFRNQPSKYGGKNHKHKEKQPGRTSFRILREAHSTGKVGRMNLAAIEMGGNIRIGY